MSLVKYRLKEVATDFGVTTKEITEIISKFYEKPKSNTVVLTEEQLNVVFDVMTQTHQIQSLEQALQAKLFTYDGHLLHKTEKCLLLERYAISLQHQFEELQLAIAGKERASIRIGATKTIGDYVLIDAIKAYLSCPSHELSLVVDNTKHLLQMLDENQLDFAIIEGTFSKTKYDY